MRTPNDLALGQPVLVNGTENAQCAHGFLGMENVVNDPLEVKGEVGEGHDFLRVGALEVERVINVGRLVRVGQLLQRALVRQALEVRMVQRDPAVRQELRHS